MATQVNWLIIGSCNGLTPVWHQRIIWFNAHLLGLSEQKNEIGIKMQKFYISSHIKDRYCEHILQNCSRVIVARHSRLLVNICSDKGLSGNNPLTESVLMRFMN